MNPINTTKLVVLWTKDHATRSYFLAQTSITELVYSMLTNLFLSFWNHFYLKVLQFFIRTTVFLYNIAKTLNFCCCCHQNNLPSWNESEVKYPVHVRSSAFDGICEKPVLRVWSWPSGIKTETKPNTEG